MVISTLPILGHYTLILFDSRSSHSFISLMFVNHVCLEIEPLSYVLSVSTPFRKTMLLNEKIKACHIEIVNHVSDATLLVLGMRDLM